MENFVKMFLCATAFSLCANFSVADYKNVKRMPAIDQNYDITSQTGINKFPNLDMSKTGERPKYVDGILSKDSRVDFDKIVFVKRKPYKSSHYYTSFIDGIPYNSVEKTAICILDLKTKEVKNLIPQLEDGTVENIDLSFDAKKILFSYKKQGNQTEYLLYEVGIDGTGLKQLTFPAADNDAIKKRYGIVRRTCDMDPCYSPDGSIIFSSNRAHVMTLCDQGDGLESATLHKLERDGKISPLTQSALSEFNPVRMKDGRIMYHRWEYVDKGNGNPKCLWSVRPDGTGSSEIYGNDIVAQRTFARGMQVPTAPSKILALSTAHVRFRDVGTIVMIDTNKNRRTPEAMTFLTPYTDCRYHWAVRYFDADTRKWDSIALGDKRTPDSMTAKIALYRDPYPLDENLFLVTHNAGRNISDDNAFGIYFLNDKGEHELVYRDESLSCWNPIVLKTQECPPLTSGVFDENLENTDLALVSVQDVYQGLKGVPRGTVKWIRILEQPARALQMRSPTRKDFFRHSHIIVAPHLLSPRYAHGIVPVESDGSAYFYVPAKKNIYFQLLDENFMMVQTERTYINYMPGEVRSCVGCHENFSETPASSTNKLAIALKRKPSVAVAQPNWDSAKHIFDYNAQVQPILDKYCVECHKGNGKPVAGTRFKDWTEGKFYTPRAKGEPLDLRDEQTKLFNTSYEDLYEYVTWPNENEVTAAGEYAESYAFGAHRSPLIDVIVKGCPNQKKFMSENEFITIADWLDTGAIYYPSYWGRRGISSKGKPDYRPVHTWESATRPK